MNGMGPNMNFTGVITGIRQLVFPGGFNKGFEMDLHKNGEYGLGQVTH